MKAYQLLRDKLKFYHYSMQEISEILTEKTGIGGVAYVYQRFYGKAPWRQDHMAILMDLIDEPYERVGKYFPLCGIHKPEDMPTKRKLHDRNYVYGH